MHRSPMPSSLLPAAVTRATCSRGLIELECRGGVMGIIMIKCPVTGRDASTGIETIDIEELPAVTAKMVCPACGRVHEDKCLARPQRRAIPAGTDACGPFAHDVDTAPPFTDSLNLRALNLCASAYGRGFRRAPRMPSLVRCHAFGCGTMRI